MSDLVLYLTSCGKCWLTVYMTLCVLFGFLGHLTFHLMVVGLLICCTCYFRLPPPNPALVEQILGKDPWLPGSKREKSINDIDGDVAHRCACLDGPENSIEALRLASKNGAKMVEFDVSFTSCGTAVVFHDDNVDRITCGSGPVDNYTLGRLQLLNLATKHPLSDNFPEHVAVPTLEEFVGEAVSLGMKMMIDLKTYDKPEETAAVILGLYNKFPSMRTSTIVTSFFPNLLYKIRSIDPDILCSVSTRPHFFAFSTYEGTLESRRPRFSGIQQLVAQALDVVYAYLLTDFIWFFVGISAVAVHRDSVTRSYVSSWRRKGVRVFAWTVNNNIEKAYFRHVLGVTCLTDTLDRVPPERWLVE